MPPRATGAEVVARTLAVAGVRRVFSLSGNQVLSLYEALDRAGIGIVHTRHEGAAVHMADGWARLTGEVGVCLVSAGPGHANAMGALAMAAAGESPLVLLSGHAPIARAGHGAFQEMDQVGLAQPLCRWAQVARRTDGLGRLVGAAVRAAQGEQPGPAHLSLPVDVLEGAVPESDVTQASSPAGAVDPSGPPVTPDRAAIRRILARLRDAARPLILVGPSGGRPVMHALLEALVRHTGVPFLIVDHPRGLADPAVGRAAGAVAGADTVLLLAKSQDYRIGYAAPPVMAADCRLLQIDTAPAAIGRHRPVDVGTVAALRPALDALLEAAQESPWPAGMHRAWGERVVALRAAPADTPIDVATVPAGQAAEGGATAVPAGQAVGALTGGPAAGLHPWPVLGVLADVIAARGAEGVCLVVDGGEFGQWARARLRPAPPRDLVNEPSGAIGYALPFAVAAKLARPAATVIAVAGDGAFGFHALELETAARCGAPLLVVVGNDGAWGTERHLQIRRYGPGRAIATDLLPARYDGVATALGGHGERVEHESELRPALARALAAVATGRPAVVDVRLRSVPSPASGAL